jgi:hypothetical protein
MNIIVFIINIIVPKAYINNVFRLYSPHQLEMIKICITIIFQFQLKFLVLIKSSFKSFFNSLNIKSTFIFYNLCKINYYYVA